MLSLLRRRVMEKILLELQRIFIGSNEVRDQIFVRGTVIQHLDVVGGLDVDPGVGGKAGRQ